MEPKIGELATLVLPVKVFRDLKNGMVDVCDDDGSCLQVSKKTLTNYLLTNSNTDYIMKAMKDAVLTVAKDLCKANNTVTTLEIKTELRRDYPYYFWTQAIVSNYMSQLAGDGVFNYTDNGTYRTYSLVKNTAATAGPVSKRLATTKRTKAKDINRAAVRGLIGDPSFESISINGNTVTRAHIRAQKKSPTGYLSNAKLAKVDGITVAGVQYKVV